MNGKTVLITGAGGQIGTDLVRAYKAQGAKVIASDLRIEAHASDADVQWKTLDVTSATAVEALFAETKPNLVIHLAAVLSATGEKNHQLAYQVNQTGTYNVLEAARTTGVETLLFTSTIAVFGPGLPNPTPDDVPLHPSTMYGVTKVSGELLCDYYRTRFGMDIRGVRFPGLISATLPGGGSSDYALFMYYDGVRVGHYEAFCRADTQIPLMYMPDGVRALIELAQAPKSKLTRAIYNIAAFSPTAAEIAESAKKLIPGLEITFVPDKLRQGILDSWPKALDASCAAKDWGWRAEYDLEQMGKDLVPQLRTLVPAGKAVEHKH